MLCQQRCSTESFHLHQSRINSTNTQSPMKNNKAHQPFICQTVPSRLSRTKKIFFPILAFIALFACWLLSGNVAHAAPVNLLYFPLTNAPGNTVMPSSTSLGGVSVNLGAYNATGGSVDFGGAVGSGVNGIATGVAAMCLTNGDGGTQPGNAANPPSSANAANSAADMGDTALAFGNIPNFLVSMWFNQPVKAPSGSGYVLPRLFVLSSGSGAGA